LLGQTFFGNFAGITPPFLFVAALLAQFPYPSLCRLGFSEPLAYLAVMRAIVGRSFGLLLALAIPMVLNNALVGRTAFLPRR